MLLLTDKVIQIFPPTIFRYCRVIFALWHGTLQKLQDQKFTIYDTETSLVST